MMRKTKRIYISLLGLVISMFIFGTVSYAWISLATINNIEGLTLTASSGNELQISIDGIEFSNRLPTAVLTEIFEDIRLIDLTSLDGINFELGGLRDFEGVIANEHYLSFDLWFRTIRPERTIYLINNVNDQVDFNTAIQGTYVVSQGVSWRADHSFINGATMDDIVEKGDIGIYHASDAIRISVIELNDDLNPLDLRDEEELRRFIYDPSENPSRGYGVPIGMFSYFVQKTKWYIRLPDTFPETSYRLTKFDTHNPYQALDNESWVATLQETDEVDNLGRTYYKAKIRVNIWVEGWDADAFDAIDKDTVLIQLQFKAADKAIE
jgi:hypothetical protein